jgi:regulator of protease activity HflC (stomatin/prohibitin superfamily)
VLAAEASGADRTHQSRGRADRFAALARACSERPELTRLRIYLETVERTLAGRKKVILDRAPDGARRQLFLGRTGLLGALPRNPADEIQENVLTEEYPEP